MKQQALSNLVQLVMQNNFIYGVTAFHDYYQEPYIAGLVPVLGYRTDLFEILLSGVTYFSERNTDAQLLPIL